MLAEYSAAADGPGKHAAVQLEGAPASSSVPDTMDVEVQGRAEQQQTSTEHAAAEQVFMYLQVSCQRQSRESCNLLCVLCIAYCHRYNHGDSHTPVR